MKKLVRYDFNQEPRARGDYVEYDAVKELLAEIFDAALDHNCDEVREMIDEALS